MFIVHTPRGQSACRTRQPFDNLFGMKDNRVGFEDSRGSTYLDT